MRPGLARGTGSAWPRWHGWAGAGASLLLHGCAFWLLLPHQAGREGVALADPPMIEIEMVDQAAQQKGQPAPSTESQPPPPAPSPPPPEPKQAEQGVPPPPPPRPPVPPAPPAPAARSSPPAVNLGNADDDQEGLRVTGADVVPPRPDAAFHNKPPAYPADAARRRREGVVHLRARVGTAGLPEYVEVAGTSGDASLDRAARDAVALWRFRPALSNGVAVPYEYDVNIAFKIGPDGPR